MSNRRPILVVHGALGSAAQMRPVADALAAIGIPFLVELPGHGETPLPDGSVFGMDAFADAIAAAVTQTGTLSNDGEAEIPAPVVFGYSMGGYAALLLEARTPRTFGGIVTLGTRFEWTPELAAKEASRLDAAAITAKVPKFADTLAERHARAGGWHRVLDDTAALLRELGGAPLLGAGTLGRIEIPVTIAVGDRDDTVSAEEAERIAGMLQNATVAVLPDVPHPIERVPRESIDSLMRDLIARRDMY
jgi:pimeloyl-ACP methyl ester carboxylesterase